MLLLAYLESRPAGGGSEEKEKGHGRADGESGIRPAGHLARVRRPGFFAAGLSIVLRDVGTHDSCVGELLLAQPAIEVVKTTRQLQVTIVCHVVI